MYNEDFKNRIITDLAALKEAGLYKQERYIATPQFSEVGLKDGSKVINMCANNYLGLANHPELEKAAKEAILSSLRATHDSPGAIEGFYATAALSGLVFSHGEYMEAVEAATIEDVVAAAQTVQLHSSFFLKGVGV